MRGRRPGVDPVMGLVPWVMRLGVWLFVGMAGDDGERVRVGWFGAGCAPEGVWLVNEPESLILAQSERWRHA
jgi:hypothetical protein